MCDISELLVNLEGFYPAVQEINIVVCSLVFSLGSVLKAIWSEVVMFQPRIRLRNALELLLVYFLHDL